jgi:triphosphatase
MSTSPATRGVAFRIEPALRRPAAAEPRLEPDLPAGEAFRRIAGSCLTQIETSVAALEAEPAAETLHQVRVGLRRLRAAASAFKAMLGDEQSRTVLAELKWLAGEFDGARDLDVLIDRLFPAGGSEAPTALLSRLLVARAAAYERALAAVRSERFGALLSGSTAWLTGGDWMGSDEQSALREAPVSDFAARALARLLRKAVKAGRGLRRLDTAARHAFRIRIKKLRYGAEFFLPVIEHAPRRRGERMLETIKALQNSLGGLNDLAVAREVAERALAGAPASQAFAAGLTVGRAETGEAALLAEAADGYKKLKRAARAWDEKALST